MMLTERASQLKKEVDSLRQLRELATQVQAYSGRAEALEGPASQLTALAGVRSIFVERALAVNLDSESIGNLRRQAEELRAAFAEERSSILKPDAQLRFAFWAVIRTMPARTSTALLAAWARYVTEQVGPQPEALLDTLGQVSARSEQVDRIRELYQEADRLAGRLPQGEGDFNRVASLASEVRRSLRSLTGEGIPDEVLVFLHDATTDGAALDRLTGTVLDWLRANNLTSEVLIHVARRR